MTRAWVIHGCSDAFATQEFTQFGKSVDSNWGPRPVVTLLAPQIQQSSSEGRRGWQCAVRSMGLLHTIEWSDPHKLGGNGALVMTKGDRRDRYGRDGSVHQGRQRFKWVLCCDDTLWWFGKGCSTSSTRAHLFARHTTQNERMFWCLDGLDRVNCPFPLALIEKIHHFRCKHPHYSSRRHGCISIFVYYIKPRELVGFC